MLKGLWSRLSFPSSNEKLITVALLSACIGFGMGVFAVAKGLDASTVFGAALTLIAAFVGAWVAFSLEASSRRRTIRAQQLEAANKLLFALYERMDCLRVFQCQFINPNRDNRARMFDMQPLAHFYAPESRLDINEVAFLFQCNHKSLLFTLNIVEGQFQSAVAAIRMRSDFHLNTVQPLMERAGIAERTEFTSSQIRTAIGGRSYAILRDSTESVIDQVDGFLEKSEELRKPLINAFTEEFSANEIFNFELAGKLTSRSS